MELACSAVRPPTSIATRTLRADVMCSSPCPGCACWPAISDALQLGGPHGVGGDAERPALVRVQRDLAAPPHSVAAEQGGHPEKDAVQAILAVHVGADR